MFYSSEKSIQLFGHEVQYHRAENKQVVTITLDNKNQMVAGWQLPSMQINTLLQFSVTAKIVQQVSDVR